MKTYKVVLDAEVKGLNDSEELADTLARIAENTEETTQALNEMAVATDSVNKETTKQKIIVEAVGEALGDAATRAVEYTDKQVML